MIKIAIIFNAPICKIPLYSLNMVLATVLASFYIKKWQEPGSCHSSCHSDRRYVARPVLAILKWQEPILAIIKWQELVLATRKWQELVLATSNNFGSQPYLKTQ